MPNVEGEQTVYLTPSFDDDRQRDGILRRVYAEVFECEREAWWTDESAWPIARTRAVFKHWFAIEMHSIVEDLL